MNKPATRTRGAVVVTRVSTGDQDKYGTSPETQTAMCRARAAQLGLPIIAEYYDGGVSGAFLASRKGMQAAIADIRERRADTLICPNIDRYSRDREHQEKIKKEVRAAGGRLVFCDMDYADTAAGNLQFNIRGDFAVFEREQLRERSMLGKRSRAENGVQPTRSLSPYGYHVPTKTDLMRGLYPIDMLGKYVVIEEQAVVVRRIFACYAAGTHSMHRICQELNAEGVPTPRGAAAWRPATIKAILENAVHKGAPSYGKVKHRKTEERLGALNPLTGRPYRSPISRHPAAPEEVVTMSAPPIVSEEVWGQAQWRRAHNQAHKGGQPAQVQMLTGFAACPACGGGMRYDLVKQGERRYRYYQCNNHIECKRAGLPSTCEQTAYLVDDAEGAVVTSIIEALDRPEWVAAQLAAYARPAEEGKAAERREIAALDRSLAELAQQEKAAVLAQISGINAGASPDAYTETFGRIAARRVETEERLRRLRKTLGDRPKTAAPPEEREIMRQAVADVREALTSDRVDGAHKRDLIATVVERVICRKGGAEVVFQPGVFAGLMGGISGASLHGVSTPQPKNAMVRPWASSAPRWAEVSTPRAPPETTVSPCAASS